MRNNMPKNLIQNKTIKEILIKKKKLIWLQKLTMLQNHKELSKLESNKIQMDYDATSLYPNAMWDEKPVYPKIEGGFCFKSHMNDIFTEAFNTQTFNQDGWW